MRPIKFRAWDGKKMWNSVGFTDSDCGRAFIAEAYMVGGGEWIDGVEDLMQFIGLKDKNGKEIYEGDIICSEHWNPTTYQVAFDRGAFYIATVDMREVGDIKYAEHFEVIGNRWENPDLLPKS